MKLLLYRSQTNKTPLTTTMKKSHKNKASLKQVTFFLGQRHFLLCYEEILAENKGDLMENEELLKIKPVFNLLLIECITLLPHKIKFACMISRLNFDSTQFLSPHVSPWIDNVIDALPPGFKCPTALVECQTCLNSCYWLFSPCGPVKYVSRLELTEMQQLAIS